MTRLEWVSVALPATALACGIGLLWGLDWQGGVIAWWPLGGVLRVLAWLPTVGVAVAVTDVVARKVRRRRGRTTEASRFATVGLLISLVAWMPASALAREAANNFRRDQMTVATSNARALTVALEEYASHHQDRLPKAARWCDEILPYVRDRRAFRTPLAPTLRCAWAFNSALSGVRRESIIIERSPVVFVFESDRGWNAAGGAELLPRIPRYRGHFDIIVSADGNAETVFRRMPPGLSGMPTAAEPRIVWQPKLEQAE